MSVIVAIKENGAVYMGADTQTTAGIRKRHLLNETSYKIQRLDNGILVGFCGRVAAKQMVLTMKDLFTLNEQGMLTKKHIVTEIIPKLQDKIDLIGDEEEGSLDLTILLAHKDSLYKIGSKFDVAKMNELGSSGAGLNYTSYCLITGKGLPVRERILNALVESAQRADSVAGPYVLIDTDKLEYEIVDMRGLNH